VVELVNRFPSAVEEDIGPELPEPTRLGFREIDNVRPLSLIPAWIQGLLRRTVRHKPTAVRIKEIWDGLVDDFLDVEFVRAHDRAWIPDIVDGMEVALKISKGLSLGLLGGIATKISKWGLGSGTSQYEKALREPAYRAASAHYIVYGHTHHHEIVPLDTLALGGNVVRQMYLNSGTWRQVHELAQAAPRDLEFVNYEVMTYLAFFKGTERGGRGYEAWSGALGS